MNYYINRDGKYIHAEGADSHTRIADMLLEKMPHLRRQFEQSGKRYADDFLLENQGYIKVRDNEYVNECTYYGRIMNESQLAILENFAVSGFRLIDITPSVIAKIHNIDGKENK